MISSIRTDIMKLIVAFRNFAKASKKVYTLGSAASFLWNESFSMNFKIRFYLLQLLPTGSGSIRFSESYAQLPQTTRRHIPEGSSL